MFQVLPHTADVGLRVTADTLGALFEDAGRGLFSLIAAEPAEIVPRVEREFALCGSDLDYLLFDWLNELLFTFEHERLLFSEFRVRIDGDHLQATARGEHLDEARHHLAHEVKAITYHGLKVVHKASNWVADVIVDI